MTPTRRSAWFECIAVGLVFVSALLVRLNDLTAGGLWMDELWAATFIQLGLKDLLVSIIRLDLHPPVYYLQLNAWAAVIGNSSDRILLMNSVTWSIVTIAMTYVATRRMICRSAALPATVLTAFAAGEVYFAQELRMYAMMSALAVLCWLLADRYGARRTWGAGLATAGVAAILAASHAASIVPVSCIGLYLMIRLGVRDSLRPRNLCVLALVGLSTLPWLVNSLFRDVSHMPTLHAEMVVATISGWLFGYYPALPSWTISLGCTVIAAAILANMTSRPTRAMVISFIIWPVAFVLTISLLIKPIWIARLVEFCAPFVCIALAAAGERAWRYCRTRPARIIAGTLAAVFVSIMLHSSLRQGTVGRKMEYREAAAFLRTHAEPGAIIYMPEFTTFWGIARYFYRPDWGNPLTIQDPVRPGRSTSWDPVYAWLGPDWLRWLNLIQEKRDIQAGGVRLVIGWSPAREVQDSETVWLVGSGSVNLGDLALNDVTVKDPVRFRGVVIQELHRARQ